MKLRRLLFGRKAMPNLDSIFKSRDITLLTKILIVKAMVFPVVMYECAMLNYPLCLTVCDPIDCSSPGSSVHGDSPGKSTGGGCDALFQGIFPTQGSNPGLPPRRRILNQLWSRSCITLNKAVICNQFLFLVVISFSRVLSSPEIEPGSPALQPDSLPTELLRKYLVVTGIVNKKEQSPHNKR